MHLVQVFDKARALGFDTHEQSARVRLFKQHVKLILFHRRIEILVRLFVKIGEIVYLAISHVLEKPFENIV